MKELYTDSLISVLLEQEDSVLVAQTFKTLMVKLKNYSGVDMEANEFDENNAEQIFKELELEKQQKECNNELDSSGCESP